MQRPSPHSQLHGGTTKEPSLDARGVDVVDWTSSAEHLVLNDPARVLAEVDAKRQILEEHTESETGQCTVCVVGEWGYPAASNMSKPANYPCRTVRMLALPYAGHPDYREEWRPDGS